MQLTRKEYRAVFAREDTGQQSSWGESTTSIRAALNDVPDPEYAEDGPQAMIGVEVREVSNWVAVPLDKLVEECTKMTKS